MDIAAFAFQLIHPDKNLDSRCTPWYRIIPTTPGNAQKRLFFSKVKTHLKKFGQDKIRKVGRGKKKYFLCFSLFFFCPFKSEDCSVRS